MRSLEKSEKVTLLATIILIGFVIAVVFHYSTEMYMNIDILKTEKRFAFIDFLYVRHSAQNSSLFLKSDFWASYFPLAYILFSPFAIIKNALVSLLLYIFIFSSIFLCMNIKNFNCKDLTKNRNFVNIFCITFLAYPVLQGFVSCNFDLYLFVIFSSFIYLFKKEKYLLAAAALAVVNACKPFFLLFLFLFLFKKRFKDLFLNVILTGLLIIAGFMAYKGGLFHNISMFLSNWKELYDNFVLYEKGGMNNTSSLFMSLKILLFRHYGIVTPSGLAESCKYICGLISAVILYFTWKEKTFWKQIALLMLCVLTTSFVVFDYKLIFLFLPLLLFVNSYEKSKFDIVYTILFGLLLIPKKALLVGSSLLYDFSSIINPFIMLFFMGLIIYDQFGKKEIEQE